MPIRYTLLALVPLALAAQDVFNSNSGEGPCLAAHQREGELYTANMAALQQKERALEDQSRRERAACGYDGACRDRVNRNGEERSRRLELEKLDENTRHEKKNLELASSRTCQPAEQGLAPCRRALSDEDWRYGQAMLELQKKELDDWNKHDHQSSDCRGDRRCRDEAAKSAEQTRRALETQREAENSKHDRLRAEIESTVCGSRRVTVNGPPPAPPKPQPSPDPQILVKTIDDCLHERVGHLNYYQTPRFSAYAGKTAYVGATVFYDPAFLKQQRPYVSAYWLASAFASHVMNLEQQRYGTPKTLQETQMRFDVLTGWIARCVYQHGVLPISENTRTGDARLQYAEFLGVPIDSGRIKDFNFGWAYPASLPPEITHE